MKRFIYIAFGLWVILILGNAVIPSLGLYKLHRDYYTTKPGAIRIFKSEDMHQSETLVIGCSNLQHNIEMRRVQKAVPSVDLVFYSGSQNSTFLKYLMDDGFTKGYKNIVLYAPYQQLEKNSFLGESQLHYEGFGSFRYAVDVIKNNPSAFFFNWNKYYDSISKCRVKSGPENYVLHMDQCEIDHDPYIDSLANNHTSYSDCNEKFIPSMHKVIIPHFADEDIDFVKSLAGRGQTVYVIYPPIPNISKNISNLEKARPALKKIPNLLNGPTIMDSTYFFDQWYHLNKCGKQIETDSLISNLAKLRSMAH